MVTLINMGVFSSINHTFFIWLSLCAITLQNNDQNNCTISEFDQVSSALATCKDIVIDNLKVPGGEQLNLQLNPGTTLTFRGNTSFEYYEWSGPFIQLKGSDFVVRGEEGSVLDGRGELWWDGQGTWSNITKPNFMYIDARNATLEHINILNCPAGCIKLRAANEITIRNWRIDILAGDEGVAPPGKFAHNTDGFGINSYSNNILIEDTVVYNQDDCVALRSGTNITIRRIFCHGSHGLSISGSDQELHNVLIEDSIVTMAENGIHIKTHTDVGEGLIQNVTYRNITLLDSKFYGINIQQNYMNLPAGEPQDGPPNNNIPIRDLKFVNIYGNVLNGAVPVYILCAKEGCFDWKWEGISILGTVPDNCTNFVPEGYNC